MAAIRFPFRDSLANRIANLITSDIEDLEKKAFNMSAPTGWQSIFKRPYKAHYANMISQRAQQNSVAMAYIVKHLREYEEKANAYMSKTDRRGRPLTQFIHDPAAPDTLPEQTYRRSGKYVQSAQSAAQADTDKDTSVPETHTSMDTQAQALRDAIQRAMDADKDTAQGPDGKPIKRFGETQTPKITQSKPKRETKESLQQAMEGHATPNVGEDRVREIADEEIEAHVPGMVDSKIKATVPALVAVAVAALVPQRVEVTLPDGTKKDVGVQHVQFPALLKIITRFPVWLPGPAGSGKTTAAKNCASALDIPFHHHGAVDNVYQLLGFIDAGGTYHGTSFRAAYEHGGVFLWDEVDASNPAALVAFNAAIENGECVFPDKTVSRHPQCYFVAAANTYGTGATHEYVGRTKLDAATLDRFVMLDWPYDEKLELAIAGDTPWTRYVQAVRQRCKDMGVKHLVTPRASIRGNELLAQGFEPKLVIDMTIRKGLADDQWVKIIQTVGAYRPAQGVRAA